ncbi:hypothetical protein WG904_10980 [Pedobacter sp. Du54]|uniref:hypothetical protein n=1 Tax=Pedobacter anseongensis TaxID=3133439 RepID=UPI0030B5C57B
METNQKYTENEINALANSTQAADEPKSAHATSVTEKYVKKRRDKAEKQTADEHKTDSLWGSIKYVIL